MPLLGFPKQWLDPHRPFAHRLLVTRPFMVGLDPLQVLRVERAVNHAAVATDGTCGLNRTGVADGSVCTVDGRALRVLGGQATQGVAFRAAVFVRLWIV